MINKDVCDIAYIWNPSNCQCECDKSCDVGEYLDYDNCKYRKRLLDKLVEKCVKTIKEVKIFENRNKCSSCIMYIVLFSIFFAINIGLVLILFTINTWTLIKKLLDMIMSIKQKFNWLVNI